MENFNVWENRVIELVTEAKKAGEAEQWERMVDLLEEAERLDHGPAVRYQLGCGYLLGLQDEKKAEAIFERIIADADTGADESLGHLGLGILRESQGAFQSAVLCYKRADVTRGEDFCGPAIERCEAQIFHPEGELPPGSLN
jgi:hypothetical protein